MLAKMVVPICVCREINVSFICKEQNSCHNAVSILSTDSTSDSMAETTSAGMALPEATPRTTERGVSPSTTFSLLLLSSWPAETG
ncbi:putative pectate lyase E [Fusarium oxysporum f. sp. albedinis]|nr:putative pectate lyase E [Fusarium oxysporum f. sp. albedinis]